MDIKVIIRTPPGQALKTEKLIKPFILGDFTKNHKVIPSKKDNKITWIIKDCDSRRAYTINKRITMFETTIKMILENKTFRKAAKRALDKGQKIEDLEKMLKNQTSIKIIKS